MSYLQPREPGSYPDPRYDGEGGEISATIRRVGAAPELDGRTTRTLRARVMRR